MPDEEVWAQHCEDVRATKAEAGSWRAAIRNEALEDAARRIRELKTEDG